MVMHTFITRVFRQRLRSPHLLRPNVWVNPEVALVSTKTPLYPHGTHARRLYTCVSDQVSCPPLSKSLSSPTLSSSVSNQSEAAWEAHTTVRRIVPLLIRLGEVVCIPTYGSINRHLPLLTLTFPSSLQEVGGEWWWEAISAENIEYETAFASSADGNMICTYPVFNMFNNCSMSSAALIGGDVCFSEWLKHRLNCKEGRLWLSWYEEYYPNTSSDRVLSLCWTGCGIH